MKGLISLAINRPVAVIAAVLMILLFGLIALNTIPIQLTPNVNRPIITIKTGGRVLHHRKLNAKSFCPRRRFWRALRA